MTINYKELITPILMAMLPILAHAQKENIASCGPVPTENQLRWQDMEMYAFIHYSLNTYTDQEWGFGNEDPKLFSANRQVCEASSLLPSTIAVFVCGPRPIRNIR